MTAKLSTSIMTFVLSASPMLFAQQNYSGMLDPSVCYSNLLRDVTKWQNDEDLRYSLLTKLTREDYDYLKANGTLQVLLKGVPLGGTFEADRDTATKLVQERDERYTKQTHTTMESSKLSDTAAEVVEKCINGLLSEQAYGLFASSFNTDQYTARLILDWRWIDGRPITIVSSTINGGRIVEQGASGRPPSERTTLYDESSVVQRYMFRHKIYQEAQFVLKFNDPNRDMNIILVTDPDIKIEPIVIRHTPERKICITTWRVGDSDQTLVRNFPITDANWVSDGRGGWQMIGDMHVFQASQPVDGIIYDVLCEKDNQGFIDLAPDYNSSRAAGDGRTTNTGRCMGKVNAGGKYVRMTLHWKNAVTTCDNSIPWPKNEPR